MNHRYRIVNATAIKLIDGLACVKGEVYSGIALAKMEDIYYKADFYERGVSVSNWFSIYGISDNSLWVNTYNDRFGLDPDGCPLIDNKPFHGVAFEEKEGSIRDINFSSDNNDKSFELEINKRGEINYLYFSDDSDFLEQTRSDNGFLKKIEFSHWSSEGSLYIEGHDDKGGRIRVVGSIDKDFFDAFRNSLRKYQLNVKYPLVYEKIIMEDFIKSETVSVENLGDVLSHISFSRSEEVEIESSLLTQSEIFMILDISKPKRLTFNCKNGTISESLTDAIKQSYPNLSVNVIST